MPGAGGDYSETRVASNLLNRGGAPSTTILGVTADNADATEIVRGVPADSPLAQVRQTALTAWLTLHADVPRRLYHYTRMGGLRGIVETKSFWRRTLSI